MTIVRAVYRPDGGVSIIAPAPKSRKADETEEDWLERVFTKATLLPPVYDETGELIDGSPLYGLPYDDIDASELPADRSERDAWGGEKGKGVKVNRGKADKIAIDRVKAAKISGEMRRMAEQSLKDKGEL